MELPPILLHASDLLFKANGGAGSLSLKEIFGSKEVTFKKLRDFRVTKWRKNPFVQGAYSYIAVGSSGDGECKKLR